MAEARVIVAGGRRFNDYPLLERTLDRLIYRKCRRNEVEIVSGTAPGADTLGERWAHKRGYRVKQFPADWKEHGRAAGPLRNEQMGAYATHLIAFWDGHSSGTRHMIETAKIFNLKVKVLRYD